MRKLPISLVIIALDEQDRIERCIRSASFVDDVVVVDSFSKDQTAEVARTAGARVFQEKWRGFGPQKRFAVEQAKHDWILSLDADEEISPDLAAEIVEKFSALDPGTGYRMPRLSFHMGRWIRHGGWYPDYQLRLFNRKHSQWSEHTIHERVVAAKTATLKNQLRHYGFRNLAEQVQTNNRYSSLQSDMDRKNGKKFSLLKLIFKPWSKFMETYFWKLGFLDGMPGFIISVSAAYSAFLRHAKLWERKK